jgi:hypothetical protein
MIGGNRVVRYSCIRHRHLSAGCWAIILLLMLADGGCAFDRPSPAGPFREIRLGLAAHDADGLWSRKSKENGLDLCAEVIFNRALLHLLSAAAYPAAGVSLNTRGDTSKVYGGVLLQWETNSGLFFSTGLGLALHDGKLNTDSDNQKSLGSRVLFRIPVEVGYAVNPRHRIALAFDHVSNAGLVSPNEGMDTLGLLYGYRF